MKYMKSNRIKALSFNIHLDIDENRTEKDSQTGNMIKEVKQNFEEAVRVPVIQLNRLSNGFSNSNESDTIVPECNTYDGYHQVDSDSSEELIVV